MESFKFPTEKIMGAQNFLSACNFFMCFCPKFGISACKFLDRKIFVQLSNSPNFWMGQLGRLFEHGVFLVGEFRTMEFARS